MKKTVQFPFEMVIKATQLLLACLTALTSIVRRVLAPPSKQTVRPAHRCRQQVMVVPAYNGWALGRQIVGHLLQRMLPFSGTDAPSALMGQLWAFSKFRRVLSISHSHARQLAGRGFAVLGLLLTLAATAVSQVTYVGFASATNTGSATLTVPNVNPSGTNKLLLVSVGLGNTNPTQSIPPPTIVSVSYNGTPMNLVQATIGSETRCNLYSLVAPANGPNSVLVTVSSATVPDGNPVRITASAAWFTGVHQTTPLGTPSFVESSGTGSPLNLTLASTTSDDLVYSAATVDEGGSPQVITVDAGQTTISNQSGNAAVSSAASYEPGTGASVTSTYTFNDAQDHSGIIVAIKKAPACVLPNCGTVTLVKNP